MKVSGSVDGMLSGQYYAPSSPSLERALFRLVWIEVKTGLSILGELKRYERGAPWTGSVPDNAEYVKARGLQFRKNGGLDASSRRKLDGLSMMMIS
jgi:hypothetical protein